MDPIELQKLQPISKYKKKHYFLNTLIFYSLTVFTGTLFCSSPLWFPSLFSSTKSFLFISIPKMRSFLLNPTCLFIVCNIIIVFLVGESKLVGSSSSSSAADIYDEYVKRSQNLQRFSSQEEKKESRKLEMRFTEETTQRVHEDGGGEKAEEREDIFDGDDLKRRVEDFIARVNRQRKLEAEQLI
ncbi:uncharacterized protein LOC122671992 [Telopea speciosissima]|uniref:uncharacterized protein LOC122671992 n=1 Tax=Telopea speciosissima TaxID=54955 RepID=UPI001CC8006D|nr:uncharacterized protein LOC122671992 [Telopea speciosissima]